MKLLALSNGHGEDEVAVRVLRQLQQQAPHWQLQAMPLVGEGYAYQQSGIQIYGPTQSAMPSGGFLYMSQKAFLRDVGSGLLSLTWKQLQASRRWSAQGGCILAVGDIVPLLFAKFSGAPFTFIGTAKSEYYLRSELPDSALKRSPLKQWLDCVYQPWERSLMQDKQCRAVFPRDCLTATMLKQWPIPVFDLGNPMMDDLEPQGILTPGLFEQNAPKILLIPGSRPPEAYANWQLILESINPFSQTGKKSTFIAAIANQLDLAKLSQLAASFGWQPIAHPLEISAPHQWLKCSAVKILLVQQAFSDALHLADVAIAMAGTATEQFAGFGKPAITLSGDGPQFTWAFAEAQSRLLGPSVYFVEHPDAVSETLEFLLQMQPQAYLHNAQKRMGIPGASARIADKIQALF